MDTHKVTRGLGEHMLDVHKTFHKNEHGTRQRRCFTSIGFRWLQACSFSRSTKYCTCHTESSSCTKSKTTTVLQNKTFNVFKKSSKLTKYTAVWPTPANVWAKSRKCHAGHFHMKKSCPVSCCPAKQLFRPYNVPKVPRLPQEMDIVQKTSTLRGSKTGPSAETKPRFILCEPAQLKSMYVYIYIYIHV